MTVHKPLPFDQTNDKALKAYPGLVQEWLPDGKLVGGKEWVALNPTRADNHIKSFSINIKTGKWGEFAGGEFGGDPISLYAYLYCGGLGHRNQACKELAEKLGVEAGAAPPRTAKPDLKVVSDWKSQVPPPPDAGRPTPKQNPPPITVHEYRMPGVPYPVRYVARYEDKSFLPYTYGTDNGKTKWHAKHPNNPMCLYGLERLGGKPVLLQEGEQKSDDVQKLLPGWACLGWSGGGNRAKDHDYSPVTGEPAYVVGDAVDGIKGMTDAADCLNRLGAKVFTLDLGALGFPKGWDLGNAATGEMWKKGELVWKDPDGPWSGEKIEAFIRDNARIYIPDLGDVDEDGPDWPDDDGTPDEDGQGDAILPLGHDKGIFYYLSRSSGQIHALTPSKHVELELIAMADPVDYWLKREDLRKGDDKGGIDWKKAAAWLIKWSKKRGIFKPDKIRGRGAWMDEGRAILHLGESMIVDGAFRDSLALGGSRFVYEAAQGLGQVWAEPVRNADAHKLLKMCQLLRWDKPISATLAAGWIAIAPICGVLKWRPSIWITGGSNSGKTTFLQEIIGPILGRGLDDGIAANVQSKTTEAGLRQILNSDARPVIFDEAEAEMLTDKTRMQSVIDLVRQSSSEGGAEIIKGTQNQSGAKRYRIRSAFLFSSINISLTHMADESRITVLDLYNPGKWELERDRARWLELVALLAETTANPEWCAGMVARSVRLMKTIRTNAQTFKVAVIERLGNARAGDQLGTLLAGAYSLNSDREITLDEARAYLARPENDFAAAAAIGAPKDEERLASLLMQQRLRMDLGDNKFMDRNVGQVIEIAEGKDGDLMAGVAQKTLRGNGMKLEDGGVWFSNTHSALAAWLEDTPWSISWGRSLKRLEGAKSSEPKSIKFGKYDKTKAVWVPLKALEGDG